ncbi:hypothetical protein OAK19_02090 [Aureispira]|nr:hypothetical protein [Aureispira sp.]
MKKQTTLARIAWGICILTGIALSIKALREPDLWWMYRTGEWMLENWKVTKTDPFSYTFFGTDWINVKWLYELLIVSGKNLFGVEFIFVFQAIVTILILTFYYKSANLIKQYSSEVNNYTPKPFAGVILIGLLLLFTIDFRLIGRPEMTSHLMVSIYLYLFWRYYYEPSKLILALIPLQILWTNMHEAYGTGMVLLLAYLSASWAQYIYLKKTNRAAKAPRLLTIAVLISIVSTILNPRGFQMLLHPFEIFSQLETNQYTTELAPIWKSLYWEKEAYLNLFFLSGSLLFIILTPILYRKTTIEKKVVRTSAKGKKKKGATKTIVNKEQLPINWLDHNIRKYGIGNGLLYFMLLYLSITAYRNIPFFIIASAPILAIAIDYLISKNKNSIRPYVIVGVLGLAFYITIITGKYHTWTESRDQYGLQVLSSHNPTGAAQFIEDNNIRGLCFSDYLTSAYLLWKLQPDFKTYIDLRDLDIFPKEFFSDFAKITSIPSAFEEKDDSLDFDYIVLFRPQFLNLQKHLIESSKYELVFVDPVACVYLKDKPSNDELISKYGFKRNGFRDIFSSLKPLESSLVPYLISKTFNPLYEPSTFADTDINAIAGSYYLSLKHINLAFNRAKASIQSGLETWKGNELMGNIYNNLAFDPSTVDTLRTYYIQQASYYYGQSINENPKYINAIIGKATLSMQQQDFSTAIFLFNEVLEIDPNYAQALQYLGMCHKILANQSNQSNNDTKQWLDYMLRLDKLNPDNPYFILDIGIAYCSLGNCLKAVEYLTKIIEVPGLPPEEYKTAVRCLKNCSK